MLVASLVILILGLASFVGLLAISLHRISGNVGPLSLEEHARRTGIVYAPISLELAGQLETFSKPMRMRVELQEGTPLAQLVLTTKLTDEE